MHHQTDLRRPITPRHTTAALRLAAFAVLCGGAASACPARTDLDRATAFPLQVVAGERHLSDAEGRPFLVHGDTGWSLIADLRREEVDKYLRDRQARGFNTILVNLIESMFARNAPANAYGEEPFIPRGDYGAPNPFYFDHAEWVLRRACALGFVVLLAPSYAGNGGGGEGWYGAMVENGPDRMLEYGRFLGRRFGGLGNVIWVHGGDFNVSDKALVDSMVRGIEETAPEALHTAHASPGWAATDYWTDEPWLDLHNIYTYEPVFEAALREYGKHANSPFFLIESAYENEHGADDHRIRVQAYQALLSGASGHIFGNNPIWHFSGPGLYPAPGSWQQQLNSPGAQSMQVLKELFGAIPWWLLKPDTNGSFLRSGIGSHDQRAVAALAEDGSFGLVYMPTPRSVTLDLSMLAGPRIYAEWLDPVSGEKTVVNEGALDSSVERTFIPESGNGARGQDWLLQIRTSK